MNPVLRRFLRNQSAIVALIFLLLLFGFILLGPNLIRADTYAMDLQHRLEPPSWEHPFGRDHFGRDLFARMVLGGRVSLLVGLLVVTFSALIGTALGVVAGYFGGRVDNVIMRLVDLFLSFPATLLALALVAVLGPSVQNIVVALAAVYWTQYARVIRGVTLALKSREFVEAASSVGASTLRIISRHILPNCLAEVLVIATLGLGHAIVAEASLSFLGLGIQPPEPSWGGALNEGMAFVRTHAHMVVFPGLMILSTVLAINLLGDGLRDALDPKSIQTR